MTHIEHGNSFLGASTPMNQTAKMHRNHWFFLKYRTRSLYKIAYKLVKLLF